MNGTQGDLAHSIDTIASYIAQQIVFVAFVKTLSGPMNFNGEVPGHFPYGEVFIISHAENYSHSGT